MRNVADEKPATQLSWNKKAAGWWSADHKGYKLQVCEEKQPMHPPAFLVYIDGRRMGPSHANLGAAQAAAATLID